MRSRRCPARLVRRPFGTWFALARRCLSRTKPEPKGRPAPSAVRANLDDPPIYIRPIFPPSAGAKQKNHSGSGHYGGCNGGTKANRSQRIFCRKCQESGDKRLIGLIHPLSAISHADLSRINRNQKGQTSSSAVRANLDDPPIHIRPIIPASAGAKEKNHVGSGH